MIRAGRAADRETNVGKEGEVGMLTSAVRWGGIAAMVAGATYAGQGIMDVMVPQAEVFAALSDYLMEAVFIVALLATMAAIAGLHALHGGRYGRLGTAGSLVALFGHALMLLSAAATLLLARQALGVAFVSGFPLALLGLVLLGVAVLRARVLPRYCGVLLTVAFPLSIVLESYGGGVLLGIAWALVGYAILTRGRAPARRTAAATG